MPPTTSAPTPKKSRSSAARTIAPAIPLAIALLHGAVIPSTTTTTTTAGPPPENISNTQPVACGESIEDYLACHSAYPTGCNTTGSYDAYLNELKNQVSFANTQVQNTFTDLNQLVQLENKIPDGLKKNNHADLAQPLSDMGEGKIYRMMGYLYGVKSEGKESSNCQLDPGDNNENVDFHIYIGFDSAVAGRLLAGTSTAEDKKLLGTTSAIVEMTPHYRGRFEPDWSLDAVKNQIGKQVLVTGQLMVDNEHYVSSQDCGRKDHTDNCWRATVWELHPVTDFKVCESGTCTATATTGWVDLPAATAGTTAAKKGPPKGE